MKVLVATDKPFAKVAIDQIKDVTDAAGMELVLLEKYGTKDNLLKAVADADAMIVRSDVIDAEVFDAAKQLKIVVRAGAGYDNIDLAAATAHNVCVMNTPGQNSNAVQNSSSDCLSMPSATSTTARQGRNSRANASASTPMATWAATSPA